MAQAVWWLFFDKWIECLESLIQGYASDYELDFLNQA